jgi:hypothetical protein
MGSGISKLLCSGKFLSSYNEQAARTPSFFRLRHWPSWRTEKRIQLSRWTMSFFFCSFSWYNRPEQRQQRIRRLWLLIWISRAESFREERRLYTASIKIQLLALRDVSLICLPQRTIVTKGVLLEDVFFFKFTKSSKKLQICRNITP